MGFTTPGRFVWLLGVAFWAFAGIHDTQGKLTGLFFEFTQPLYNVSIPENARGRIFAINEGPEQIAVVLPLGSEGHVKFKIVSGDEGNMFRVVNEEIGNKVFLRVRLRPSLEVALNRELKYEYMLVVKARLKQAGRRNLETTTQVRIKVSDGNDLVPYFYPDTYTQTIAEHIQPLNDEIVQVKASDADEGLNGQVYFSLLDWDGSDFSVHPVTGNVQLVRNLDYKRQSQYNLTIQAEDRASRLFPAPAQYSYISTASVKIFVKQSNVHPPVISVEDLVAVNKQTTKVQTVAKIVIKDDDNGEHGELRSIRIAQGNQDTVFQIVPDLDNDNTFIMQTIPGAVLPTKIEKYNLEILAIDNGYPSLNSSAWVKIVVQDPPPNPLRFDSPFPNSTFRFVVNETALIDAVIGSLSLGNSWVPGSKMEIIGSTDDMPFNLDPDSGLLTLVKSLDRESIGRYAVNVKATADSASPTECTVVVTVLEENDNTPEFTNNSMNMQLTLSFNAKSGDVLAKVEATDNDDADTITYRLAGVTDNENKQEHPFVVDRRSGQIELRRELRKDDGPHWVLWIRAADNGTPLRREAETYVVVSVEGHKDAVSVKPTVSPSLANTHPPQFVHKKYSISALENTPLGENLIPGLRALDSDPGYSGLVRYVLERNGNERGFFEIDMYSGFIRLVRRLDDGLRPSEEYYELTVRAEDGDGKYSHVNVDVEVVDVNDHPPVFDRPAYALTVSEDVTVGTELVKVTATDLDRGLNARIRFRFITQTSDFLIDPESGVVTVSQELDREMMPFYHLMIRAYDGGTPPQKSLVSLNITVSDINDNSPRCVRKMQKVQLAEDWPPGALVTCIPAHDPDEADNAIISYTLESTDQFAIDADTGCVFVKRDMDFETGPLHNITVEVTDGQLATVCSLIVELLDVDENRFYPHFTEFAFEGKVKENEPIGTEVVQVHAVDDDNTNEAPTYSIVGGDAVGLFNVDSKGVIRTLSVLDRERRPFYWLKVSATDSGNGGVPKTAYTDVYVQVLDDNDHIPQMKQYLYFGSVTENSGPDTLVTRLSAWDKDDSEHALSYRIIKGDPQSFFKIDPPDTGYMTTHSRKLDREAQSSHVLEVEVRDVVSGLASVAVVVVDVDDVNDNAPKFQRAIYNFDIPPINMQTDVVACRVFASDKDTGVNGELYYNMTNSHMFSIVAHTGEIRATGNIAPGETFHLTVTVSDGGNPAMTDETQVMMVAQASPMGRGGSNKDPKVVQANDIHISENEGVGESLGLLEATDEDNDHLWFDILDGNVNSVFSLRKDSGELQIAKPLNTISETTILLTYAVSDTISSVSAKVKIHIDRSSSIRPEFEEKEYVRNVTEMTEVGTEIIALKATVPNTDALGLTYTLHTVESVISNSKFKVDARTGRVILVQKLDHEQLREHRLVVAVRYRQMINFATVIINVLDVNDHSPEFLDGDYVAKVVETSAVGTLVLQVMAIDKDSDMNGVIAYTIISGNEQGLWSMNAETGQIVVAKKLSLDLPETVLVVRASDRGQPLRSDSTTVRILVVMHQMSPPRFNKRSYTAQCKEQAKPGTYLTSVYADSPAGVRYSIRPPADLTFDVHPTSGAITLRKPVDFEKRFYHNFTVVAISTAGLKSETTVRVTVVDSNDHAPVFEQQVYEGIVPENTPAGTVVKNLEENDEARSALVVSAVDDDEGSNSVVSYQIDDPWASQYFAIDFFTGAVRTSVPLDFEQRKSYEFEVMAADHGIPTRQSIVRALVRITVEDTNDHAPQFVNKDPIASVFLPTAADVVVVRMHAYDNDSVGELTFYPVDPTDTIAKLLHIHPKTGVIKVFGDDLENRVYEYKIGVTDGVHSSVTTVTVTAETLPSNTGLSFSQSEYAVNVYENTTSKDLQHVLSVYAVGASIGEQVDYKLLNEQPWFVVNSVTGAVATTGVPLDREVKATRRLVVQASDHRAPPRLAQAIIVVTVLDTNDCAPSFVNQPYYAVVPLDAQPGDNVTHVRAIDRDEAKNGEVLYQLHSDDPFARLHFQINPETGIIFVANSFPKHTNSLDLYMTVTANDQGAEPLSSSAVLRVKVVDRATPVFGKAFYQVHVSEDTKVSSVVLSVSALSNVGGFIGYSIIDGDKMDNFDVDYLSELAPNTPCSLTIGRRLDRETQSMYNLTVRAKDVSREGIHADVPVVVYVDDVNDNPPVFKNKSYNVKISEATPVGSQVHTVLAMDKDLGQNAEISYSLEKSSSSSWFEIGRATGQLFLKKPLDYETDRRHTITVVAHDAGVPRLSTNGTVVIDVLDVNDNAPVFANQQTDVHVPDDTNAGKFIAVLSAYDPDSSDHAASSGITFNILSGDVRPPLFSIGSDSGIVRTARDIASESHLQPNYLLNVSVSDGVFSSYAKLNVTIVPTIALTEPPAFERTHFMAAVKENGIAQTVVTSVVGFGGSPPLQMSFGGASHAPFKIDPQTGQVVTKSALDYELEQVYRLPLVVKDAAGRQAFAELSVNVLDENDNTPKFVSDKYELMVPANATVGSHIVQFVAHDLDKNDLVEYSMIDNVNKDKSMDIWRLFRLQGGQGVLTVKSDLSQFVGKKVALSVRATDQGNPPQHADVSVTIEIVASDRPMPIFTQPRYLFHILEDVKVGTSVGSVQTVLNGRLPDGMKSFLKIVPLAKDTDSFPFSIDQNTGEMTVVESLDRESRSEYEFMIASGVIGLNEKPRGQGLLALVLINVDDVNDNAPKFQSSYAHLEISEDAPVGSSLAVISATDSDLGAAATVYFRLNYNNKFFKIDETSGWLLLGEQVDRETQAVHNIQVVAFDGGRPSLTSDINITVNIIDANDKAPTFDKEVYHVSVVENVSPGEVVGKIQAVDEDLPPNNFTSMFIVEGDKSGHFELSSDGTLTVRKRLDYEKTQVYNLRVLASDGKHTGTCEVVVNVQDANDNAPVCEVDSSELYLPEDMQIGTTVFTLIADDADSGKYAQLFYSVSDSQSFDVTENGNLITKGLLDRETQEEIDLIVYATDTGGLYCSTHVHIFVTDVNDNTPEFDKPVYELTVKENLPDGPHFLLTVNAVDRDLGLGGRIQYALEDETLGALISVDELTGAVLVMKSLDREERAVYELTLIATDQDPDIQLSSTAKVVISVADENDNPPLFVDQEYTVHVKENEDAGYKLVQVQATSADSGNNALIGYKLLKPENALEIFELNSETGSLTLKRPLDFEKEKLYVLTIDASDSGIPPLSATCIVTITVTDQNDHPPKFTQALYELRVKETELTGVEIMKMSAHDADASDENKLKYRMDVTSGTRVPFTVSPHGHIILKDDLDREKTSGYRFVVEVVDSGTPPLSDKAVVQVVVLDENDNAPKFENCNLTIVMEEDNVVGLPLLDVQVYDDDGIDNGPPFKFSILGNGADRFAIDDDGVISAAKKIMFSEKKLYLLTVSASDCGSPSLTAECPLSVHVLEKSKHPPVMGPVTTNVLVYMNEFAGGRIARVTATDKDPRDIVTFKMATDIDNKSVQESVALESPLSIDSKSGWITASPGLTSGKHVFNVSASDARFTTYAPVTVNVESVPKDALQYAVAIKLANISPEKFIEDVHSKFRKSLAQMLSVQERQIQILSMQSSDRAQFSPESRRFVRAAEKYLEMLFAVKKGKSGYYKPQFVRRRMEGRIKDFDDDLGVEVVSLVTEVCRRDLCVKGVCKEKITLDDVQIVTVVTQDGQAFVSPTHRWTHQCMCYNGFGGDRCDVPINSCSRDLCPSKQMCIAMKTPVGFRCSCPPDKKGSLCSQDKCTGAQCSSGETAVTFTGNSFLRYALSTVLDTRLELAVDMRTVAPHGIIMHSAGQSDFNILEVSNGYVQYRFDCGSGEGVVRIGEVTVTDGNWHLVSVVRRGRHAKLTLDSKFTAEGFSPTPNSVINLDSTYIYFGGQVVQGPSYQYEVVRGFTGCINRIYMDGFELSRSGLGIQFDNVEFGCTDSFIAGVCSSQPCQNFGSCIALDVDMYSCQCHPRFTGRNCEIDLNPCSSKPCAQGSICQNLYNDFICQCKPGFRGKTCKERGYYDACASSPCGSHGMCQSLPESNFECKCQDGWSGFVCEIKPGDNQNGPPIDGTPWGISVPELIAIGVVLLILIILTAIIVCCCRKCGGSGHRYEKAAIREPNNEMMMDNPITRNPLHFNEDKAPPLPPRSNRGRGPFGNASRHSKLSNLEYAQQTGLPTGLVRPMAVDRHYSPSLEDRCSDRMQPAAASNLQSLHNYGSAAEELEQISRYSNEFFAKPNNIGGVNVHRAGSSGETSSANGIRSGSGPHVQEDWRQAVDMLSLDSIDRIKAEQKAADELAAQQRSPALGNLAGGQSLSSIQCLPEDEPNPAYHWDYSDWNSTLDQRGYPGATLDSRRSDLVTDDEDGAPLPQGVSAIDDTDSEFVAEIDDELSAALDDAAHLAPSVDFKKQLMQLQKLADKANKSPKSSPMKKPLPPEPEDEYVTMKPLSNYQRHLDKYLPKQRVPDSAQSQRKPLLQGDGNRDECYVSSDDSDGGDSCAAVVQFGGQSSRSQPARVPPGQIAAKLQLHTYDIPPRTTSMATNNNRRSSADSNANNVEATRPLRRDDTNDSIPLMDDDNDESFAYPAVTTVQKDTTV